MMKKIIPLGILVVTAFSCSNQKADSEGQSNDKVEANTSTQQVVASEGYTPSSTLVLRTILDKIEVLIPRTFKIMDAEMIAVKYPLKQRAAFQVYTDEDATINIAFDHTSNKASMNELPAIKKVLDQQFNQPGIDFRKSEIKKINGRDFIVVEMITPAVDTKVYNLMIVTSLEDRLLMGTFNCTVDQLDEWKPLAEQIVSSVKVRD